MKQNLGNVIGLLLLIGLWWVIGFTQGYLLASETGHTTHSPDEQD